MKKRGEEQLTNAYGVTIDRDEGLKSKRQSTHGYARHFEGYRTQEQVSADGKRIKYVRVYVGPRFRQELEKRERFFLRIQHALLFIAAVVLLIAASALRITSNYRVYVLIATFVTFVFYARYFLCLVSYLPSGQELKLFEYRDGAKKLPLRAKLAAIFAAAPILASVVMFINEPEAFQMLEVFRLVMLAVSGICLAVSGWLEARVQYTILPGEWEPDPADN